MTKITFSLILMLFLFSHKAFSQDPDFYVFLSLGQSNMEGYAKFEPQDTVGNSRLRVLQSVNCPELKREKGKWYTATPPMCRCKTGLTPTDYFGRTLIAALPPNVKVGIINVSVGGCKIELFDKENYQ